MKTAFVLAFAFAASASLLRADPRPTTGTLLHYRFNEESGATTAIDSSGNGHHATYGTNTTVGEPSVPGMGKSISIDNSGTATRYVDPSADGRDSALYQLGQGSFTFEALIKFDTLSFDYNHTLFSVRRDGLTADGDFYLTVMGSDAGFPLALSLGDSTAVNYVFTITPPAWQVDQWYHIALTVDQLGTGESSYKFHLALAGEAPVEIAEWTRADLSFFSEDSTQRVIEIGSTWGFNSFPGQIDEVRLSYGALTEFQMIPEPSTFVAATMGLGLLMLLKQKRR